MRARNILSSLFVTSLLAALCAGCSDDTSSSTGSNASGTGGSGNGGAGGNGTGGNGTGGAGGGSGGGSSTGSSSGGGSSTGSTGSTGSGGGTGMSCTVGMGGCDPGYYCNGPGCGAGTCTEKPPPGIQPQTKDIVCGCDGVTYWNADIATAFGVSVKGPGECMPAESVACSPMMPCGPGLSCNRKVGAAGMCGPTATGVCWGLPISCALDGPQGKGCTGNMCFPECSLIQSQNPWYSDPTCP